MVKHGICPEFGCLGLGSGLGLGLGLAGYSLLSGIGLVGIMPLAMCRTGVLCRVACRKQGLSSPHDDCTWAHSAVPKPTQTGVKPHVVRRVQ